MNIFEQYGIKEVADVTLYAIELDKYDDEVYVPILYFDTLKVSTVEQTAEQTSARGGLGNPELIIWDYGKEITVTLEDALYSPASQSLMWGGKFGTKHSKIYGVWNPIDYPVDDYGRKMYLEKRIAIRKTIGENLIYQVTDAEGNIIENLTELDETWIEFTCPCDDSTKWMKYYPLQAPYKYLNWKTFETPMEDQLIPISLTCQKGYAIYSEDLNHPEMIYALDDIKNLGLWKDKKRPEMAELIAENFGDFNLKYYQYTPTTNEGETVCLSTEIDTPPGECECSGALGYTWDEVGMKMTSLEGDQDIYYLENGSIHFRVPLDSNNKNVSVSYPRLYKTSYNENTGEWVKEYADEKELDESVRLIVEDKSSYGYYIEQYDTRIDFFIKIKTDDASIINDYTEEYVQVKVGTFYIIDEWNVGNNPPQDWIYPIEDGMNDVPYFDRMEKCKANQTFAINADTNLLLANRRLTHRYDHCEMTVYIDPKTMKPYEPNSTDFMRKNGTVVKGNLRIIKQHEIFYRWTRRKALEYTTLGHEIVVDATHYPGTYRLVGETYARSRATGKDERYQFELPLCKMSDNTSLTLQADGDPTTFSMELKCLRREDGTMMKLTQYMVDCRDMGGTDIVLQDGKIPDPTIDEYYEPYETETFKYFIVNPIAGTIYYIDVDTGNGVVDPFTSVAPYLTIDDKDNYPTLPKEVFSINGMTNDEVLTALQRKLPSMLSRLTPPVTLNDSLLVIAAVYKERNYSEGTGSNQVLWVQKDEVNEIQIDENSNIKAILDEAAILERFYDAGVGK